MNAIKLTLVSLFVLLYMLPVSGIAPVAYGQNSNILVGASSTTVADEPVITTNLVALTPNVVSVQDQAPITITLVQSQYQQEQAAAAAVAAAQKAAQAAAEAPKAKAKALSATPSVSSADVSYAQKLVTAKSAAAAYGINWKVLAAVWQVESDMQWQTSEHSYAGAIGPCQFLPSTWAHYAYDGDGNGTKSIYQASDCLYGAAHLLAANGASSGNNTSALLSYNHSMAYVNKVLSIASTF